MAKPLVHGSPTSCNACHADQSQALAAGKHAAVSCQVCHAPLLGHARDGEKIGDMPTNPSHKLCEYCHGDLVARPDSIPQVDARGHLLALEAITQEEPIAEGICGACHDVHSPAM